MKRLHRRLTVLILLLSLLTITGIALAAPGTPTPDHITLSLTSNPSTSITITWRTDIQDSATLVQYAPKIGQQTSLPATAPKVNGTVSEYASSLGRMNIHRATLTNLKAGTSYLYRVGDGSHWSSVYTFNTEPLNSAKVTALVFSDTQSGSAGSYNYQPWKQILTKSVSREHPDFAVIDGDLTELGLNQKQWDAWFNAVKGTMENLPLMPVEGNHETFKAESKSTKPTAFTAQFTVTNNGPAGLKGQVYSYDYGPVHFVVLDSQGKEEGASILTAQKKWLDQDLKATKQPWKVVFLHKPPYDVKNNRSNNDIKNAFCSILEQNHVDLVISGHDHTYERTYPILNGKRVTGSTVGTIYVITGRSGAKTYTDVKSNSFTAKFYKPLDQPIYSVLQVNNGKLQLITKKSNGTMIDSFSISKKVG